MPTVLTRVPQQQPPRLRGAARRALPVADAFMAAMLSRPRSGSLATTWVTPATIAACALCDVAALGLAIALLAGAVSWPATAVTAAVACCALLIAGATAVLAVGTAQRRA